MNLQNFYKKNFEKLRADYFRVLARRTVSEQTIPCDLADWDELKKAEDKIKAILKSAKRQMRKIKKALYKLSDDGELSSDEEDWDVHGDIRDLMVFLYGKGKNKKGNYKNCLRKDYEDAVAYYKELLTKFLTDYKIITEGLSMIDDAYYKEKYQEITQNFTVAYYKEKLQEII